MNIATSFQQESATRFVERTLASFAPLTEADLGFLRSRLVETRALAPGQSLDDDASLANWLVLSGWLGWVTQLADGRRQIISLALPGDLLDQGPIEDLKGHYVAFGAARIAEASALVAAMARPGAEQAGLARAWGAAREAAAHRTVRHVLRLGRLSAYERTASLLLELHDRLSRCGLDDRKGMPMPLTQEAMADILGLSAVHMNRTLQEMRRAGLLAHRGGWIALPDRAALSQAANGG